MPLRHTPNAFTLYHLRGIFCNSKNRKDGIMWIEKLDNGKFKAVERYEDVLTKKQKRVSVTMEKNTAQERKKAQEHLTRKIFELQNKDKTSNFTMKEVVEAYRKDKKGSVKESTYVRIHSATNTFLKIFGEDTLISMLTAKTVKDRFRSTKKTNHTLNEYLARFKQLIRWAYKNDMISNTDFIDKMDRFKDEPRKTLIADKYLESDEVKILLDNMAHKRYRDLTEFLVLTGLRIGEALALNIDDVDTKERVIHVTKTWDTNNFVLTDPKTQSSVRDIYMQDELFALCKRLKKEALEKKLCSGFDAFFQNKSRRYTLGNYTAHLKNDSAQYLNHSITPHALRHTHVSLLAEQGVSFDIISRRLGHDGSQVTKDIYFHVTEGLKKKDSEQLKSIKIL